MPSVCLPAFAAAAWRRILARSLGASATAVHVTAARGGRVDGRGACVVWDPRSHVWARNPGSADVVPSRARLFGPSKILGSKKFKAAFGWLVLVHLLHFASFIPFCFSYSSRGRFFFWTNIFERQIWAPFILECMVKYRVIGKYMYF